jgi:hypothetical protein
MATKKTVETWAKEEMSRVQVEQEREGRLNGGAISSTIAEDANDWILTTIWPATFGGDGGGKPETFGDGGGGGPNQLE